MAQYEISRHLTNIIEPLSEATCQLLREERDLADRDYVSVSVEDDVVEHHDGQIIEVQTKRFQVRFKSREVDKHPSYELRNRWWQRIPGAKISSDSYGFTAPPTDITSMVIMGALGRERIVFEDETAELEFMTSLLQFAKQQRVTKAPAGFKQHRTVPNDAPAGNPELPPMPHQRVAAWAASRSNGYHFWMEQSTGKTYAAQMAVEETCERGKCQMVLLVCPKNVRMQWQLELEKFATKRVRVIRFAGWDVNRVGLLLEAFKCKLSGDYDYVVVVSSYQIAVNSCTQLCAYPWDWVVCDEEHSIKWHRAKRTVAMHRLRDRAKRRLGMTGTPIANLLFDLYSQLEFGGRGWSGFTSFEQFKNFYGKFNKKIRGRGLERLTGLQNLPLLQERLARMAFLLRKQEALPDMPNKAYELIEVEMSEQQEAVYDALATQLYAEIEHDLDSGKITVTNILTKLLRLSQVTSGFCVLDGTISEETGEVLGAPMIDKFDPNPKIDALVEYLKNDVDPLSKVIIWCTYVQDIKSIRARLELEGVRCCTYYGATKDDDRVKIEADWNSDPELGVLIGNAGAGGVGLNLQGWCDLPGELDEDGWPQHTQCDVVIFYSQDWSSLKRSQGEERPRGFKILPDGTRKCWQIKLVDLVILDTIDMEIRKRVVDKRQHALDVTDVRSILGKLLMKRSRD